MVGGAAVALPARGPPRRARRRRRRASRASGSASGGSRSAGVDLLVNGRAVLIRGVNRHDFDQHTGRVVAPRGRCAPTSSLMKQFGLQRGPDLALPERPGLPRPDRRARAVRHRRGRHRVARASTSTLCDDPRYLSAVGRPRGADGRARQEPPVGHRLVAGQRVRLRAEPRRGRGLGSRRYDPSRPLHYEGAIRFDWTRRPGASSDLTCPMYPPIAAIVGPRAVGAAAPPADHVRVLSHAMGNSNGTLAEYWDAIESTPGLQGGFIWEWLGPRPRPDAPRRHDRAGPTAATSATCPTTATSCIDGIVCPDREPEAGHVGAQFLAAPVRAASDAAAIAAAREGRVELENRRRVPRPRVAPGGVGGHGRRRAGRRRGPAAAGDRAGRHAPRSRSPAGRLPDADGRRALADAPLPDGRGGRLGAGRLRGRLGAGAAGRRGRAPRTLPGTPAPHHIRAGPATSRSTTRGTSSTPRSRRRRPCPSGAPRPTTTGSAGWPPAGRAGA